MLEARINLNGRGVYYQFQLVSDSSEFASTFMCPVEGFPANSSLCLGVGKEAGALPIGFLPAGSGPQSVSLDLDKAGVNLKVGSTYHYRVIVAPSVQTEDTIQWEGPPTLGPDQSFTVGEDNVTPLKTQPPTGSAGSDTGSGGGSGTQASVPGGPVPIDYARPLPKPRAAHAGSGKRGHKKHRRHHRSKAAGRKRLRSNASHHGR